MTSNLVWFALGCIFASVVLFCTMAIVYVGGRHDAND